MIEKLSDTFSTLFRRMSGNASITEANVAEAMQAVRTSLLEADVNKAVVDDFCDRVVKDAVGQEVLKSLRPGEAMIGIVYERLVELLGGSKPQAPTPGPDGKTMVLPPPVAPITRVTGGPTVVMMCGLQGSGKTTTCGKIAAYCRKKNWSVMLAACDLQRPAAVEQLHTLADQVRDQAPGHGRVLFHGEPDKCAEYGKAVGVAVQVAQRAYEEARRGQVDVLILDTAGRLHVNDELMGELARVKNTVPPHHIFLVVDAMTGQDAVNSAKAFHQRLEVDGVILTKFDSDTRGGAALSVRQVTGAPIKFVGVGEKIDALEEFHAERFAGRILGMGDVLSLVEKAQEQVSVEEAEALQDKIAKGQMGMDDFLRQLRTLRRMGPMKQLLGMLPGVGGMLKDVHIEDKQLDRIEAIVGSMTKKERANPALIDIPRRRRIAKGSGVTPDEVAALTKQFDMVNKMTRQMASLSTRDRMKAVKDMGAARGAGALGAGPMPGFGPKKSSFTPSIKSKFKKRK
ncbi:MAG: signal recognition particle protein [Phycisphaerae bacterium]|nr:MAG: signal recognition particle protein [Phycisphaerae bacterium]